MRVGLVIAAVGLALLAGCGGNGGGGALTKDEFVQEADAICADVEGKLEDTQAELESATTPEELAQAIDESIPAVRDGVDRLRGLEPPDDLQAQVDEWLELTERNLGRLEDLRDAAEQGDQRALQEIATEAEADEERADGVAREIGLDDCAEEEES